MKGGEPIFTDSKYRAAPDFAITHKEDNDTPVQSQSEREKNVAGDVYKRQPIGLVKKEFDIVELLSQNAGQVFDKERIYERV